MVYVVARHSKESLRVAFSFEPGGTLLNGLLRILTLGVYHFWGKTEVRQRIWSAVRIDVVTLFPEFISALLACGVPGVQLTWMDAKVDGRVITPRIGKPVEINALFYNALRYGLAYVDPGVSYYEDKYRKRVVNSLQRRASQMGFALVAAPEARVS